MKVNLSFQYVSNEGALPLTAEKSKGSAKSRVHLFKYTGEEGKDRYAVAAEQVNTPKLNWIERKLCILHQHVDKNGTKTWYKINKNSLKKRLNIDSKELTQVLDSKTGITKSDAMESLIKRKYAALEHIDLHPKKKKVEKEEKPIAIPKEIKKLEKKLEKIFEPKSQLNIEQPETLPIKKSEKPEEIVEAAPKKVKKQTMETLLNIEPGKVRKGSGEGKMPDLIGKKDMHGVTVMDTDKMYAACFSACFHTTESIEEIMILLHHICEKIDRETPRGKTQAAFWAPKKHYTESLHRLYNNLVELLEALPGENEKKSVKIYWNEQAEKVLIPYLIQNQDVDIHELSFAIMPGEEVKTDFQSPDIDFKHQLQFVGLSRDLSNYQKETQELSEQLFKQNIMKDKSLEDELKEVIKNRVQNNDILLFSFGVNALFFVLSEMKALRDGHITEDYDHFKARIIKAVRQM